MCTQAYMKLGRFEIPQFFFSYTAATEMKLETARKCKIRQPDRGTMAPFIRRKQSKSSISAAFLSPETHVSRYEGHDWPIHQPRQ